MKCATHCPHFDRFLDGISPKHSARRPEQRARSSLSSPEFHFKVDCLSTLLTICTSRTIRVGLAIRSIRTRRTGISASLVVVHESTRTWLNDTLISPSSSGAAYLQAYLHSFSTTNPIFVPIESTINFEAFPSQHAAGSTPLSSAERSLTTLDAVVTRAELATGRWAEDVSESRSSSAGRSESRLSVVKCEVFGWLKMFDGKLWTSPK